MNLKDLKIFCIEFKQNINKKLHISYTHYYKL